MTKDPKNIEIGLRIKQVRTNELCIPQWKLAEELDFANQSTIASYEVGAMEVGAKFLTALYKKYRITPNYILTGKLPIIENKELWFNAQEEIEALKIEITILSNRIDSMIANK